MDGLAIAASLHELRPEVEGAFVRTAYQPTRDSLVLRLSGARPLRLRVAFKDASIHLTDLAIPNPETPSGFAMLLRKHFRGGRVSAIRQSGWDRVVTLDVERRNGNRVETIQLIAELTGLRGNVLIVREGSVLGAARTDARNRQGQPYRPLEPQSKLAPDDVTTEAVAACLAEADPARALAKQIDGLGRQTAIDVLRLAAVDEGDATPIAAPSAASVREELDRVVRAVRAPASHIGGDRARATSYAMPPPAITVPTFSEALDQELVPQATPEETDESRSLRTQLLRVLGRNARTAERLKEWLEDASGADRLQLQADLLLTYRTEISSGATSVSLTDPATDVAVEIRLDPAMSAVDNAQRLYRRARRLRRGRPQVKARLTRVERTVEEIRAALQAVEAGDPLPIEATVHLPKTRRESKQARTQPSVAQPRRLEINGYTVLIGRNAQDNDRLLQAASPDDVWMHARGVAGSHVLVRRRGEDEIPEDVLLEAAKLAARNSKAGGERKVAVTFTAAKHVRKPKGAPAGLAIVRHEDTLTVQLEPRE